MLSFILGAVVGGILNAVWWMKLNRGRGVRGKYRWGKIWTWLEHYHWSTILFYLGYLFSAFFYGVGLILWIDESVHQRHKFAYRSKHFIQSLLIEILILLIIGVAELVKLVVA